METMQALKKRKSSRSYLEKAVEENKVTALADAANNGPKAGEIHITVVENKELLKRWNDITLNVMKNSGNDFLMSRAAIPGYQPLYGAPLVLLISAQEGNPYNIANASCAATMVTIAATELGLGSCYVITPTLGLAAEPAIAKEIGIPDGNTALCGVLAGYAGEDTIPTSKRDNGANVNYCR